MALREVTTARCASPLTGKTVPGHGVYRLYDNRPEDEVLFTERLRRAGYHTALFGKLHVSGRLYESKRRHPNDGFDVYEWCLEPSLHMESDFSGYARWLREVDPAFHDRLARERRELLHVPRERHMTLANVDFVDEEVGRVLAASTSGGSPQRRS